nr:transmembrane protein 272-like [Lytechinus pictus]
MSTDATPPSFNSLFDPPSTDTSQQDAAPPSYDSLFGQIRSEREKHKNPVSFIGSVFSILFNTCIVTLFLAIILAIPIAMVAIGSVYIHECPAQHFIPLYLIVMGLATIFKVLIDQKARFQRSRLPQEEQEDFTPNPLEKGLGKLIGLFITAWFIPGNIWIYGIFWPNTTDSSSDDYCHPTLYIFAFWVTTAYYIFLGLLCCCAGCIVCLGACIDEEE